jgi:glycosyltransferase involved in cell wall biosynthesis
MQTPIQISVIICTHNPRPDYLRRVLEALKAQTLPKEQWELLVIDNASKEPLAPAFDLPWHPRARHIRENELGLTPARLRGILESEGECLLFVDDDNVIFPDYLAECSRIAKGWPLLGVWGGQQFPEFEGGEPEEAWKREFWTSTLKRDVWSNNYDNNTVAIGAGLCIRRQVARKYAELARGDPLRLALDRKASTLNSCGDFDMAFVSCDLGFGTGRFVSLKLNHLMPMHRVSDDYLVRLNEGFGYSQVILAALRGIAPCQPCRVDRIVNFYKRLRLPSLRRRMEIAFETGRARAIAELNRRSQQASK